MRATTNPTAVAPRKNDDADEEVGDVAHDDLADRRGERVEQQEEAGGGGREAGGVPEERGADDDEEQADRRDLERGVEQLQHARTPSPRPPRRPRCGARTATHW